MIHEIKGEASQFVDIVWLTYIPFMGQNNSLLISNLFLPY